MANLCENTLYVCSEDPFNIRKVLKYFDEHFSDYDYDIQDNSIDIYFSSKWAFPESEMNELFDLIPNKEDIYMRCLSVEYGNLYHALWVCDENGWHEV